MRLIIALCLALGVVARPALAAESPQAMVVSTQRLASQVGIDILKRGGNAVDAAIAIGYALAVVHPAAGNIGGGGFMTIRSKDGTTHFLDFRERAPLAATATMFQDAKGEVIPGLSEAGYLAAGIPGTVRGFELAGKQFGTMEMAALIAPAVELADRGFRLKQGDIAMIRSALPHLRQDPIASAIFLKAGKLPRPGDLLRQPDLAQSLRMIAAGGADAFYNGPIADEIVAASQRHKGIFQKDDFIRYQAHERPAITCDYRGYQLTTAAPPSSGGVTLCEILNILEGYDLASLGFHSAAELHLLAEAMRFGFYDRNSALGDPDFVTNPVAKFLDKNYAAQIRARILPDRATRSLSLGEAMAPPEGKHTTDYVVIDRNGLAVSVVYTLNDWFGAKVVAGSTGIVLNNEMDDFAAKPGVPNEDGLVSFESNAVRPGKAPLSSMAPTILSWQGETKLIIGSFGSGTIITSIAQAIVNLVDFHMGVQQAIDAPRIHQQWLPDAILYDPGAFDRKTEQKLREMGYSLKLGTESGASESILTGGDHLLKAGGRPVYVGANDQRAPVGAAIGW